MTQADTKTERLIVFGFIIAAVAIRFAFWIYTSRLWEDSLITVLHAENLWQGLGLSHLRDDGVPVHGFTSPISVLVPVIGGAIDLHGTYAMPFIQFVSAIVGPATVWLAWQIIRESIQDTRLRIGWLVFSLSYLAIEHHQILWGMAGMETQMVVASVMFAGWACARPTTLRLGIALALALYARPDFAFLNLAVCAYAFFFVGRMTTLKAIGIGAALYAPWLIFTFLYYGSPIPNTIFAKAYGYGEGRTDWPMEFLSLWVPLGPSYAGNGSGYYPLFDNGIISYLVAALVAFGGVMTVVDRKKPLFVPLAFVVIYTLYYVFFVAGVFGWYVVPLSAANVLIAGYGLIRLAELIGGRAPALAVIPASAYATCFVAVTPMTAQGERDVQKFVEAPVRRQMGEYLAKIMKDGERIGLEPLGYVGYYSRNRVLDYPGLVNPEVVELNHEKGAQGLCGMLAHFEPEYVALRPHECRDDSWLGEYRKIGDFQAHPKVGTMLMADKNIDLHFVLYQRSDLPPPSIDPEGRLRKPESFASRLVTLQNTGAILPTTNLQLGAAFSAGGWSAPPTGPGEPPTGPEGWASYAPLGDAGQGEMSVEFTAPAGTTSVVIPIVTGPQPSRATIVVSDTAGVVVATVAGPDAAKWQLWLVDLPASVSNTVYRITATDGGVGWGEWVGIGAPHLSLP